MTEPGPLAPAPAPPHLYARFSRRFWGLVIDSAVYAVSLIVLVVLLEVMHGGRGGPRAVFLLWVVFLCLYEPVLVWRRGATLGHMAANIRVVDLRTGGNPTFLRALGRFWLKAFVGLLAFAFMGTTRRHQALHDLAARTTVEIADPAKASPDHFVEERDPILSAGLPSRSRRIAVILAYSLISYLLLGVALVAIDSAECVEHNSACTPQERILGDVLGLLFVASVAAYIIFGWTGRLLGARRIRGIVPATSDYPRANPDSARPVPDAANLGIARPPVVYLGSIALGLMLHVAWPMSLLPRGPGPRLFGAPTVLLAIGLFIAAVRTLEAAGTPVPGNRPTTTIVRTGPYRFSRNPIYLAFSLLQLGIALWVNSLWLVVTLLLALAIMALVVIPREERYLAERFPSEYSSYQASVRRWL